MVMCPMYQISEQPTIYSSFSKNFVNYSWPVPEMHPEKNEHPAFLRKKSRISHFYIKRMSSATKPSPHYPTLKNETGHSIHLQHIKQRCARLKPGIGEQFWFKQQLYARHVMTKIKELGN